MLLDNLHVFYNIAVHVWAVDKDTPGGDRADRQMYTGRVYFGACIDVFNKTLQAYPAQLYYRFQPQ